MPKNVYKRNLLVPSIKILFDIIAVQLAVIFSFWLRFYTNALNFVSLNTHVPDFISYFYFSFVIILTYLFLFGYFQSYKTRIFSTFSQDIPVILKTCFLGILFVMSTAFMFRGISYSRSVFLLIFFTTIIFLLIERAIFHRIKRYFFRKGFDILNICIVGSNNLIPSVLEQIESTRRLRFTINGYVTDKRIEECHASFLGPVSKLPDLISETDGLVLAFNQEERHIILEVLKQTEGKNIDIFFIPDLVGLITSGFNTIEGEDFILLQLKSFALSGWQGFLKRVVDMTFSIAGLLLLSPILMAVSLITKLTSPGPVLYKQERIGMDGRVFKIFKFRSMVNDAEDKTGAVWAKKNDPRVTAFGGFLRRTSIDELPQLFNVIKGEMSLVGPRPERPQFVREFASFIPKYQERHRFRSGITGWAQANGLRGQSSIEERTKYDVYYIENWSLGFDLKIIILTMIAIFKGENAY
jgi:exopolysaccharide biosynthesis polyprenyl glycosylphosphotransferase